MNKPVRLGGKTLTPELLTHLNDLRAADPRPSKIVQARTLGTARNWFSPTGRPALASAQVALYKLEQRGLLAPAGPPRRARRPQRLRASGQPLPPGTRVPGQVDRVRGLHLHRLTGADDPLHGVWNDLLIQQHPCGAAPLAGTQPRYLVGSEHGWLGAVGFGPAAFCLAPRDHWIGWSTAARTTQLRRVIGLARLLIRTEVNCQNLASKVLHLAVARLAQDWQDRYGCRPLLVETFVDRTAFTGRTFAAGNWQRLGTSSGRGRLGTKIPSTSRKDIWVYPHPPRAHSGSVNDNYFSLPATTIIPYWAGGFLWGGKWCVFAPGRKCPPASATRPTNWRSCAPSKKKRSRRRTTRGAPGPTDAGPGQPLGGDAGRLPRPRHRRPARHRNIERRPAPTHGPDRRLEPARRRRRLTTGNFIL